MKICAGIFTAPMPAHRYSVFKILPFWPALLFLFLKMVAPLACKKCNMPDRPLFAFFQAGAPRSFFIRSFCLIKKNQKIKAVMHEAKSGLAMLKCPNSRRCYVVKPSGVPLRQWAFFNAALHPFS